MKLENLIAELGKAKVDLPSLDIEKLRTYAALLKVWNEKMNLTSIVEEEEVVLKHFYDCLLPLSLTSLEGKKIADIGSGAGFPGLVWAIAVPSAEITLIDATKKKFAFLEEVVKTLQIPNIHFHIGRVEEMKEEKESFDLITSRGFAAMPLFLEVGAPLLKVGGEMIAMRGAKGNEEMRDAKPAMEILGMRYGKRALSALPGSGDIRQNFLLLKAKPTPEKYPRDWAKLLKHPLR